MENMNLLFTTIHDFLLVSLPKERKCSENTIRSYKKTLELFLDFVKKKTGKPSQLFPLRISIAIPCPNFLNILKQSAVVA